MTDEVPELDLAGAVSDGVYTLMGNLVGFAVMGFMALTAMVAGFLFCGVGWVIALPLVLWGVYSYVLECVDGDGQIPTLLSGRDRFGDAILNMWVYQIGLGLLSTPIAAASLILVTLPAVQAFLESGQMPTPTAEQFGALWAIDLFWGLLIVRFFLAPFFVVDRGENAIAAFLSSWRVTRGSWLKLIGLHVILEMLESPGAAVQMAGSLVLPTLTPEQQLMAIPVQIGGTLVTVLAAAVSVACYASVYRQLTASWPDDVEEAEDAIAA